MRKKGAVQKLNLALGQKCVVDTINDCRKWQDLLDPSWLLLLRMSNPAVDEQLTALQCRESDTMPALESNRDLLWKNNSPNPGQRVSIFKPADFDVVERREPIPYSSSKRSCERYGERDLIMDSFVPSPLADIVTIQKSVRDLARLLASLKTENSASGLLSCVGVSKRTNERGESSGFDFAFAVPENLETPRSLRHILLASHQVYPLDERFHLAKVLARSVLSLHTYRFVHENIRPETVLVFQDGNSILGTPFLVGFETFRPMDSKSYFLSVSHWEKNLYRHPRRQGI